MDNGLDSSTQPKTPMKKNYALLLIVCLLALAPQQALGQNFHSARLRKSEGAIPGHYIVVFNKSVPAARVEAFAAQLAREHGGKVGFTYRSVLRGFSVELTEAQAVALSRNQHIEYVEQDTMVEGASTQPNAPWGLDRIDQRTLPLDTNYSYLNAGTGTNVYIIDSGIRMTHQEFGGRAVLAHDNVGDGQNGMDCNGHGTHVAGIIGGNTYGVAKNSKLHSVRVLNCLNQAPVSRIIAGMDWVAANSLKPAVANLSFITTTANDTLDLGVRNLVAAGVTTVVAAGNNNIDAGTRSPARVTEAITVAASDMNDNRATFSNFGAVVDVFAPGVDIVSASSVDDASTNIRSGTSSAAPFVAGLVARYLAARPGDQPDAVSQAIMNSATAGKVFNAGAGTLNLLAYAAITISDDFNDNTTDASKWSIGDPAGGSVVEQNGRVEVTPPAETTGYNGYFSVTTCDLTNSRMSVQVTPGIIGAYGPETHFTLGDGDDNMLFATSGSNLLFQTTVGGVRQHTYVPYSATQHRFWRFRHNRTTDEVFWETSPDGVAWSVQRQTARPFSITNLQTRLLAGKYLATAVVGTTTFDNLWHESNPTPPVAYGDNFDDNLLDARMWKPLYTDSPVTVAEQNQQLELALMPNTAGYNGLITAAAFDFRDKVMQVEVPQTASQAGWVETFFQLYLDDSNYFTISTSNNSVACDVWVNGVRDRSGSNWDGSRYWRYRHNVDANTVSFETSANGTTWTTLKTVNAPFALGSMKARLISGAWGTGNATPGTAVFDNFRIERYHPSFPQSDNFNDNARDAKKWSVPATTDFTFAEQNGRLEITPGTAPNHESYTSVNTLDLTDARASVEAVSVPAIGGIGTYLLFTDPSVNNYLLIGVGGTALVLQENVGGVVTNVVLTYNAAQHRYWRIRHNRANDTVNWETSADNVTWTVHRTSTRPFSITQLQTQLMAGKNSTSVPSMTSIFDNLRIERNEGGKAR
jgi:subtilisin family serine protease